MSFHLSFIFVDVPLHMENWHNFVEKIPRTNNYFSSKGLILNSWSVDCTKNPILLRANSIGILFYYSKWLSKPPPE